MEIVALESRLNQLLELREQLVQSPKLTLDIALEADQVLGDRNMVTCFFDERKRAEKHQIALEALDAGIMGALVGLAIVLGVLVAKLIEWLFGGSSSGSGGGGGGGALPSPAAAKASTSRTQRTAETLHHNSRLADEINKIISEMKDLNEAQNTPHGRMASIVKGFKGLDWDIMIYGKASKAVETFVDGTLSKAPFEMYQADAEFAGGWFTQYTALAGHIGPSETTGFITTAHSVLRAKTGGAWRDSASNGGFNVSNEIALSRANTQPAPHMSITQMFDGLGHTQEKTHFVKFAEVSSKWMPVLSKLKQDLDENAKKLKEQAADIALSGAERGLINLYHDWMMHTGQHLRDLIKGIMEAARFFKEMEQLGHRLQELTELSLKSIKPMPGGRTVVDMGEVEEVRNEIIAIGKSK